MSLKYKSFLGDVFGRLEDVKRLLNQLHSNLDFKLDCSLSCRNVID